MPDSLLDDKTRILRLNRGETLWIYDDRDMGLYSIPANDSEARDELEQDLSGIEERPPFPYRTRTRISNIKLALSNRCPSDCSNCFRPRGGMPATRPGLIREALIAMVDDFGRESGLFVVSFNLTSEPLVDLAQLEELEEASCELSARTGSPFTSISARRERRKAPRPSRR